VAAPPDPAPPAPQQEPAPAARETSEGQWGAAIGDAFGARGLGLSGVGEGGGGRGEGIGVCGCGETTSGRVAYPASVRQGAVSVTGNLPAEVVQRIVRQNFGRFRLCYENGLRSDPLIYGRVATRFVIDRSGAVESTNPVDSDIADTNVLACIARGFKNLAFPQPEGGTVSVVYPLIFIPPEPARPATPPRKKPTPRKQGSPVHG
jgi:hypothetical protein